MGNFLNLPKNRLSLNTNENTSLPTDKMSDYASFFFFFFVFQVLGGELAKDPSNSAQVNVL